MINKDFDFFIVTTSDKYIKGGASFLDIENSVVRSIVYDYGKSFYIMTFKDAVSRSTLIKWLQSCDGGENLSLEIVNASSIKDYLLLQLFFNSVSNPIDKLCSYNNLSGKLLCYKPSWIHRNDDGIIWGLDCLEIRLSSDMCINMNAHRMTSLMLKNKMKFGKRKLHEYPQYEFSYNNYTLKRVSKDNLNEKTNIIQKPVDGERGLATFFDFKDYDTFSCTKNGLLYDIMNIIEEQYSSYFTLHFKSYEVDECREYKRKKMEEYKDLVEDNILTTGINLIDEVGSETSADYLNDLADAIKTIIPDVHISQSKRLSGKKLNIRYIHNKDFYRNNDPHQDDLSDYAVQHITVEKFNHRASAAVYNVLKELVIKKDLKNGKITISDWTIYDYSNDWIFGMVSDSKYFFMTVHPDGTFKIEQLERNFFTITEYDLYMDYFGVKNGNSNNDVVGLVKDSDGNINLIRDTNKYSIPNFSEMGNTLKKASEAIQLSGSDVIELLNGVINCTNDKKVISEINIAIAEIKVSQMYSKQEIVKMLPGKNTKYEVVDSIYKNTGILLYTFLRGETERNEYMSGNIDINYIKTGESLALYSVGEIGNGMRYTIERASLLREIQAAPGSKLIFDKLLPLMGVEFVRYGMLTVLPFPFKYLREYINQVNKSNK